MNLQGFPGLFPSPSKLRRDALRKSKEGNEAASKARQANHSAREKRKQAEDAKTNQQLRKLEEEVFVLERELADQEESIVTALQGVDEAKAALYEAESEYAETLDFSKTLSNALSRSRELLEEYKKRLA
jgi:hypothetical protein